MATYACSDLHGMYDLYIQIKNYVKPEDTIYVLGDCCDRGPRGWDLVKAVYEDEQCVYIRGNHEELFVSSIQGWPQIHLQNGGGDTLADWGAAGGDSSWEKKLMALPAAVEYVRPDGKTVLLAHAGCDICDYKTIDESDLIWDRVHMKRDGWSDGYEDWYLVHGHSPLQNEDKRYASGEKEVTDIDGAYHYCGGHKINIDAGSFKSGKAILLNLDTFESIVFSTEIE